MMTSRVRRWAPRRSRSLPSTTRSSKAGNYGLAPMRGLRRMMASKRWLISMGVAIALVVGGIAYASIPDSSGVIHGCLKDGKLRIIDTDQGQSCVASEQALNWNQTGPQGPAGVGASLVNVVKHYDISDPRFSSTTFSANITEQL